MQSEAQFFRDHVPLALRRALVSVVCEGCSGAYSKAKELDPEFRLDGIPSLRRLEVEPRLSKLVLPKGFEVEITRAQSTHYTKIKSDRIVITAVTRSKDVGFVNPYRYRETLAQSRQLDMFAPGVPASNAKLYALLVYGGEHRSELPTLARIEFPLPSGRLESDGIDLLVEHDDIVRAFAPPVPAAAPAMPKLRRKSRHG